MTIVDKVLFWSQKYNFFLNRFILERDSKFESCRQFLDIYFSQNKFIQKWAIDSSRQVLDTP